MPHETIIQNQNAVRKSEPPHLNDNLLLAFLGAPTDLTLTIPDIFDYSRGHRICYHGAGRRSIEFTDVLIGDYRRYLIERGRNEVENVDDFKKHRLEVVDENDNEIESFSIFKCFLFECVHEGDTFHFAGGDWFQVNPDFITNLNQKLDPHFVNTHPWLPPCEAGLEATYNEHIANLEYGRYCLDGRNISPVGQTAVEPCDVIRHDNDVIELVHVKISTRSSSLSHLFNQGYNSAELLRMNVESREKLKLLVSNDREYSRLIDENRFVVTYGIVTRKASHMRSQALPLFSRISLLRILKSFKRMNIPFYVYLIPQIYNENA